MYRVYSIRDNANNPIYYGMTRNIGRRLSNHNCRLKSGCEYPVYKYLREHGVETITSLHVEKTFDHKEEAHDFEQDLVRENKENICNSVKYYMTPETNRWSHWYLKNREARLARRRERIVCQHCSRNIRREERLKHYAICCA